MQNKPKYHIYNEIKKNRSLKKNRQKNAQKYGQTLEKPKKKI
jgi:hypothetical protein